MRIMKGRGRPLMTAAVVAISGLGLAGGVAGTAQAALPDAWGFALVQTPSGAAVAGHWAESVPSPPPTASAMDPTQSLVSYDTSSCPGSCDSSCGNPVEIGR